MKITFLGTSHGIPAADRFCSCTMIEAGNSIYLIDAGIPVAEMLLRHEKRIEDVKAVFTTHAHGDHIGGIPNFADLVNWAFKNAAVDFYMTEQNSTDAIIDYVSSIENEPLDTERVRFHIVEKDFIYEDGNVKVTPFITGHLRRNLSPSRPAYGYIVEADGKRAVFSGDLSIHLRDGDFPAIALEEEVDLAVCELAHFSAEEVAPFVEKCKAKQLWFNHVYPMHKLSAIKEFDARLPFTVKAANDGDVIEL